MECLDAAPTCFRMNIQPLRLASSAHTPLPETYIDNEAPRCTVSIVRPSVKGRSCNWDQSTRIALHHAYVFSDDPETPGDLPFQYHRGCQEISQFSREFGAEYSFPRLLRGLSNVHKRILTMFGSFTQLPTAAQSQGLCLFHIVADLNLHAQ